MIHLLSICSIRYLCLGYLENNQANKAVELFNEVKNPDEILVTLLFHACAELRTNEALNLVKKVSSTIPKSFYFNPRLLTSLLDALMKCGDIEHAQSLFNTSTNKVLPMYGAMMKGYNISNNPLKTINLFNQMKIDGIEGDLVIYLVLIKALSKIGDYCLCQSFVEQIPHCFFADTQIQTVLIDMWVS
jgi:pentatricopeptide repeat protein